jgi:MFS transporter, DHA1 family, tetracycline resistance protein
MDSNKRRLGVLFLVVVIDLLGWGLLLPMLPRFGERLQASPLTVGLLLASFSAMQFWFSPRWGALSDRIGRRPVLMAGLAGSALFYLAFAYGCWTSNLWLLFIGRIGAGIAGATIGTAQAYIADSTAPERRSSGMMLIGLAFGVGFTLGPALGVGALALEDWWRGPAAAAVLPMSPALGAAALSALALLFAWRALPESRQSQDLAPRRSAFDLAAWRLAWSTPGVGAAIIAFFLSTLAFGQFETTLSPALKQAFGLADKPTYWVFVYVGMLLILVQGAVRPLAKKWPDEKMAFVGAGGMLAGIALALFGLKLGSLPFLLGVMPVLIFGYALLTPALQATVSKRAPAERQGAALGVSQSASSLARIFAQLLGVWLLGFNLYAPYLLTAGLLGLALAVLARKPARSAVQPDGDSALR